MAESIPATQIDSRFSSEGAPATPWESGRDLLQRAEVYWLSTVRPDGRPHVTPLIAVWLDGALHFATGPGERKAHNLERNRHCVLTTGSNAIGDGMDVALEGEAARVTDDTLLRRLAALYKAKYDWDFEVRAGSFWGDGGEAYVFAVPPGKAFGFVKGESFSQTRWRFVRHAA